LLRQRIYYNNKNNNNNNNNFIDSLDTNHNKQELCT